MSRGRRKPSIGEEKTIVKRQASARVFSRIDGGQKAAKFDSHRNSPTTMAARAADQQGKKRKGKVPEVGRPKEASSPVRRTRSRTLGLSKDKDNAGTSGVLVESNKSSNSKQQHLGLGNRKRGRDPVALGAPTPKKPSARIPRSSSRFSTILAKITEEKPGARHGEEAAASPTSASKDENSPAPPKGTPRSSGISLRRYVTTVQRKAVRAKEMQKKAVRERRTTVKKAAVKKTSTIVVNVARAKTTPLPGLQELRKPGRRNAQKQSNAPKFETAETVNEQEEGMTGAQESMADSNNIRLTQSKSTTNALRVAEDATGFVRTALNAVAEARMKDELQQQQQQQQQQQHLLKKSVVDISAAETIPKDESQSHRTNSNGSTRSTRSRTGLTAEKLIQELDSFRLAPGSQPGGVDMKEKLRKGITRVTRSQNRLSKQQGNSAAGAAAEKKQAAPTKLPRVANQENLPKATESALVRRVKSDIGDHAKKYGLLDQETPVVPGRVGRKLSRTPGGLEQQQEGSGFGPEDGCRNPNDWTPEQEMALQHAYISVKPAADFWYHISKQVPGKTADECFNKFYAGHPTPPPAAQRPKRQTENAAADDIDLLINPKPKGKTAGGKQRFLAAHRTIRNILRKQQVDDEDYEADAFVALERPDVVDSVLNSEEANEAVIFKVTEIPNRNPPTTSESKTNSSSKAFENIVIGGLPTSDKENRNVNGAESRKGRISLDSQAHLSSPEVLKKVKNPAQLDKYIDHLHQRHHTRRPRTGGQKPVKKSNVYLHSKEALDFGDNTLSAIQRAKEELRNVFLKSGAAAGASFLNLVSPAADEGDDGEEHEDSYTETLCRQSSEALTEIQDAT